MLDVYAMENETLADGTECAWKYSPELNPVRVYGVAAEYHPARVCSGLRKKFRKESTLQTDDQVEFCDCLGDTREQGLLSLWANFYTLG